MRFPAEGITIEEAVKVTLQHSADLLTSEAEVARRQGVLQEQQGPFDLTLLANTTYSRRIQEMTESRKAEERKKREDLQAIVDKGPETIEAAQNARNTLGRVQSSPIGSVPASDLQRDLGPTLAATIQMLDQLIVTATPAERPGFEAIRREVLDQAVAAADVQLAEAQNTLSGAQTSLNNIGPPPVDEVFNDTTFSIQLSKLFRSGLSLAPFFDGAYSTTGFSGKPHQKEFGGKGLTDLYTFHAGVQTIAPLARGRGAQSVGALERAADLDHQSSQAALRHQASANALNTALAYWQLRAAQEMVTIATQSLEFQQKLVQLTQGRAADLPGAELARAQASAARAEAQLRDAQRTLKDARVGLAIAMGVAATDDDATLPRARDEFPAAPAALPAPTAGVLGQAASRREDLAAASRLTEASSVLVESARINTRPLLDLSTGAWYTALDEGSGRNALDRWVGPSVGVSLQFEKPFGNNLLRGQLAQRQAEAAQRRIDQSDLARRINLGVVQSVGTLQETAARVQQANQAVTLFQAVIDAQFQRLQSGDASVIDTVTTEQQQVDSRLALVSARLELARQIAELRFRTGTLTSGRDVRGPDLVTVPVGAP
jgi:outer membrane protein TolC